ncbi:nucleoside deaminase [Candidatus Saccharibacteria bacterium]|nr:nucleoside deaminase [Candidatus Saccharibacteria bacterium]
MNDIQYLQAAVTVGNEVAAPYNFGAVVVSDGKIIASEHAYVFESNDPSAHAEISAIRSAAAEICDYKIPGATLYASHEPCTMCLMCASWAGIQRIVYATPASASDATMYDLAAPDITHMASILREPIRVEHVSLS